MRFGYLHTGQLRKRQSSYAILPRREVRIAPVHDDTICCTAVISSNVPPGITPLHLSLEGCCGPSLNYWTWRNVCFHTWTWKWSPSLGHGVDILWRSSPIGILLHVERYVLTLCTVENVTHIHWFYYETSLILSNTKLYQQEVMV